MLVYITITACILFGLAHLIRFHYFIKAIRKVNSRIEEYNSSITMNSVWNDSFYLPYASIEKSCAKLKWYNPFNYNFREMITHE